MTEQEQATQKLQEISREELEHLLQRQQPDNENEEAGYALVNVLGPDSFEERHIPGSINIPRGEEQRFEQKFSKNKQIVVYCASPSCDASPKTARELQERGFDNVYDYAEGLKDWREADNPIKGKAA